MKTLTLIFLAIAVAALPPLSRAAGAAANTSVVYPTGASPTDVNNVQAAINKGGTVLLKAVSKAGKPTAFNFDNPAATTVPPALEQVILTTNVALIGEWAGLHRTTIQGGYVPIISGDTPVTATIQNLTLAAPKLTGIVIERSSGIRILDCEISGVVPVKLGDGFGDVFTEAEGIYLSGGDFAVPPVTTLITGEVTIARNYIHDFASQNTFGVYVDDVAGNTTIANNAVAIAQIQDPAADGSSDLDEFCVALVRSPGPCAITGNALYVGPGVAFAALSVFGPVGPLVISANLVDSQSPDADGIALDGGSFLGGPVSNARITANLVNMHSSGFGGITLFDTVTECLVDHNLVTGDAAYALDGQTLSIDPGTGVTNNRFIDNDITRLKASTASIFLDAGTANNYVRTTRVSVIDQGTNNQIVFH